MAEATAAAAQREFAFFLEITDSFKACTASSASGDPKDMTVPAFLDQMTMFLRIFDAFSNPFFTNIVKADVQGNIDKLRAAAAATATATLDALVTAENADPAYRKLIALEKGKGASSGTVALLWMKRTMQFVCGLLKRLVADPACTLANASRESYDETLGKIHNFVTRATFKTGLSLAPTRDAFYKNLTGGTDTAKVDVAMNDFLHVFQPQLAGVVAFYKDRELESKTHVV